MKNLNSEIYIASWNLQIYKIGSYSIRVIDAAMLPLSLICRVADIFPYEDSKILSVHTLRK